MSWASVVLQDVCEFVLDGTHGSPARTEAGVPVLSAQNVNHGYLCYETKRYTSEKEFKEFNRRVSVQVDDILLTIVGTIGRSAIVRENHPAVFQRSVSIIRPNRNIIETNYLYYVTQHVSFQSQLKKYSNQSAQAGIYLGKLKTVEIPLPSLNEQRRISAILDKANVLRSRRKRTLELLNGLVQSIFFDMFGDLSNNLGGLPTASLQDVVSSARPVTYGILMPGPDIPDGIPYVRVVDIQNGKINVENLKRTTEAISREYKRSTLRAGDLLISIRGHVGRMAIAPPECDGANITQDTARLALEGMNAEFAKAQLETDAAQNWMARRTKGAAVKGLNLGDLKLFPLLTPPINEQLEFARRIEELNRKVRAARQQSRQLDTLFASLQHRAFTGQL